MFLLYRLYLDEKAVGVKLTICLVTLCEKKDIMVMLLNLNECKYHYYIFKSHPS